MGSAETATCTSNSSYKSGCHQHRLFLFIAYVRFLNKIPSTIAPFSKNHQALKPKVIAKENFYLFRRQNKSFCGNTANQRLIANEKNYTTITQFGSTTPASWQIQCNSYVCRCTQRRCYYLQKGSQPITNHLVEKQT